MSEVLLLLKTQLYNYFSLNELFHPQQKKQSTVAITAVGIVTLLAFLSGYNALTAMALANMGQQALIPTYMVSVSSFLTLIFTLLRSNGILLGSRDFEMLSALPIKTEKIIASKFGFLYLLNFLLVILFLLPGGIVWQIHTPDNLRYFLLYLFSMPFIPLIPMCIASLTGVALAALSAKFHRKNLFSLIFSFAALGALLAVGIYSMQSGKEGGSLGAILLEQVSRLYPLAICFRYQDLSSIIENVLFWVASVLAFAGFVKIVSVSYAKLNSYVLQCNNTTGVSKVRWIERSVFSAMYRKEVCRYFNSYLCVLNTGLGVIFLCMISLCLWVVSPDVIGRYAGIEDTASFFGQYAPLVIAAMLSISCPAASSISLEGKNLWILQSVPVSNRSFLNSKIALNLSIHAVGYLLAVCTFIIRFQLDIWQSMMVILVPVAYSLFTAVQGTYMNCRFPKFDWDNEIVVVKQSMAVILSGVIGMAGVAIPALLHWFLGLPLQPLLWGAITVLFLASGFLYLKACRIKII